MTEPMDSSRPRGLVCALCGKEYGALEVHWCRLTAKEPVKCLECGATGVAGEIHVCNRRSPGRPRRTPPSVPPEMLDALTAKAQALLGDDEALVAWLNERRMVAIVALGESLADPKLFLEVTDDLLAVMTKDLPAAEKKARGKRG